MNERQSDAKKKKQFKKLMKLIKQEPEKGLQLFYEIYAKIILTTALVICRSMDKANEVVNDVLVKIWKLAEKHQDIDNPEGWIYVITANTAKDAIRERYIYSLHDNIVDNEDKIQEIVDKEAFNWLIKDLSEIEQTIMIHKFVLQYTFQEIATELKKPLTTVTSIYYRALDKIKRTIECEL